MSIVKWFKPVTPDAVQHVSHMEQAQAGTRDVAALLAVFYDGLMTSSHMTPQAATALTAAYMALVVRARE